MKALRILANCFAPGKPLVEGIVYAVPDDVSETDAEALVRMGRAEVATPEQTLAPKRTRKRADG